MSALALPSAGLAATGGAGVGAPRSGARFSVPGVSVQPGEETVTASGDGIAVAARASALLRGRLQFTGTVPRSSAGDSIEIERLGRQTGGVWAPTVHTTARAGGSFVAVWQTNHIGRFAIRAVIERRRRAASASPRPRTSPSLSVTVYRSAIATQYGPGFYGQTTACGQVLRRNTIGVANRTLPCGTPVAIYYQGQTIVVPVIDRGPYANHADWDLTEATGKLLAMDGTATIGAVSLAPGAVSPAQGHQSR
ncbi:MAG: septal ring lytic transglycosylase RlpA family protein [Solirubrobacteraceae bacterium]